MPKIKPKKEPKPEGKPSFYKGYDVRWLKELGEEHPDYYLVKEYEKEYESK